MFTVIGNCFSKTAISSTVFRFSYKRNVSGNLKIYFNSLYNKKNLLLSFTAISRPVTFVNSYNCLKNKTCLSIYCFLVLGTRLLESS